MFLMRIFARRQPLPVPPAPACTRPDCARDANDARVQQDVRQRLDRLEAVIKAAGDEWERSKDQP